MADRRIKDLTPIVTLDTSFLVAADKSGETEAGSATVEQLIALISGVRAGKPAITVGVQTAITFSTPFSSTAYALIPYCYDGDGDMVAVTIEDLTTAGFNVTASASGTFHYLAYPTS